MRVGLIFLGSFLLLLGIGKTVWEMYSWATLSKLGERVPLVDKDPRVRFRLFIFVAALGAAAMIAGMIPW